MKELGEKIVTRMGIVQHVAMFNVRDKESGILKVKIELDGSNIVKSRMKIAEPNKKPMEILFKYECLGSFYSYCGHLGHEARTCPSFLEDKIK